MTSGVSIQRLPWLAALKQRLSPHTARTPAFAHLPERALLVWRERPDLQAAFDLSRSSGRVGLFWWGLLHGFREMGFTFDKRLDADFRVVNQPVPGLAQAEFTPVTWLMRALWAHCDHQTAELRHPEGQADCIAHYFAHALLDANLGSLLTSEQGRLLREDDPIHGTPRLCRLIWQCDPGLARRFASPDTAKFIAWCGGEGARAWPILAHPLVKLAAKPKRKARRGPLRGVNLFGHALARLGIGEDVRMAARSLEAAGIPYVIRNVDAVEAGSEEDADGLNLADHSPYDVNLFCMTGMSTLETCLRLGPELHEGRHSIGFWPWELPELPQVWGGVWRCVDEVWASSKFTYQAYARAARAPTSHMPMAVVTDATEGACRSDFGLPADPFLFGFSFDGLSSFARKNPLAVVTAFQRAFPLQDDGVGLVLKGLRVEGNPAWQTLIDAIGGDERIHIITHSLSRGRLLDLYRTLDSFVSLHRSEGFGRNVAEAMLLGKPVITSAHSGTMDFARDGTAALVPVRLRKVRAGEYPFGTGQLWAEPDVDAAAAAMRRMVADRTWRDMLAGAGQAFVSQSYSPAVVGASWVRRLRDLTNAQAGRTMAGPMLRTGSARHDTALEFHRR